MARAESNRRHANFHSHSLHLIQLQLREVAKNRKMPAREPHSPRCGSHCCSLIGRITQESWPSREIPLLRILTLCYEFRPLGGGGAKVAESLIEKMLARGDEIDLVTMAYRDLPRLERCGRLTIHRIPCGRRQIAICHPHEMLLYILRALPIVLRLVRERRYEINHTHFIFPDGVLAMVLARTRGLKYIVTAHGSDVPGYNPDRFKLLHRLLKPLWNAVVRNTEAVLCPSEYLKRLLLDSAPEARCQVIPNGINVTRYSPGGVRRKRILVISRMVERKGVQFLLQALAGLEHEHEVCIVGDGPYLRDLRSLAADLGIKVIFTGFIDNETRRFRELLETSSIFVFTSSKENFPMVLLEAMSAGLCIVTSDDTGCQEVVGDAAIKIPSENASAIRAVLVELMQDPARCEALGLAARARAEDFFTDDRIADQYRRIYQLHAAHDVS